MSLQNVPSGSILFVDANIFLYYFTAHPRFGPACSLFLDRVEKGDLQGVTSAQILADLGHRLMTLEAAAATGRQLTGMARWLKAHPLEVQRLSKYRQALDELSAIGFRNLPVTAQDVSLAADVSRTHGLLTNDAIIVTLMRSHGLTQVASNDPDFDRIPGFNRCPPV